MIKAGELKELNHIIEYLKSVPYDVTRKTLYSAGDLYDGSITDEGQDHVDWQHSYDGQVYRHFLATGKQNAEVLESLSRSLHDHGIHTAMQHFFDTHDSRCCVGVMGGHAQLRTDSMYRDIVLLSKQLTEEGFIMLSGGGPGAMEATHLGAWLAGRDAADVDSALSLLKTSPSFKDDGWLATAFEVMRRYPRKNFESLGIPTWLYGHEPSTPFATHIAKLFENSIREDSILTLAYGGIVYTPGSAGTLQEVFQEAVQNHYLSFGFSSPMIFFGKEFWTQEMPVYPLLEELSATGKYSNLLLTLTDDIDEIAAVLRQFRNQ